MKSNTFLKLLFVFCFTGSYLYTSQSRALVSTLYVDDKSNAMVASDGVVLGIAASTVLILLGILGSTAAGGVGLLLDKSDDQLAKVQAVFVNHGAPEDEAWDLAILLTNAYHEEQTRNRPVAVKIEDLVAAAPNFSKNPYFYRLVNRSLVTTATASEPARTTGNP